MDTPMISSYLLENHILNIEMKMATSSTLFKSQRMIYLKRKLCGRICVMAFRDWLLF